MPAAGEYQIGCDIGGTFTDDLADAAPGLAPEGVVKVLIDPAR